MFMIEEQSKSNKYIQYLIELVREFGGMLMKEAVFVLSNSNNLNGQMTTLLNQERYDHSIYDCMPVLYEQKAYNFIKFEACFLQSDKNPIYANLNLLYFLGTIPQVRFLVVVRFGAEEMEQSLKRFIKTFEPTLLKLPEYKKRIFQSVGLIYMNKNFSRQKYKACLQNIHQKYKEDKQSMMAQLLGVLKTKVQIDAKSLLVNISSIQPFCPQSNFLSQLLNSKRNEMDWICLSLENIIKVESKKIFITIIQNMPNFLLPSNRNQSIEDFNYSLGEFNVRLSQNNFSEKGNIVSLVVSAFSKLKYLKSRQKNMFQRWIRQGQGLNEFIIMEQLLIILCHWNIISNDTYYDYTPPYFFAKFMKTLTSYFLFQSQIQNIQTQTQSMIIDIMESLLGACIDFVDQQCNETLSTQNKNKMNGIPQSLYSFEKLSNIIEQIRHQKQYQQIFQQGKRIRQTITYLRIKQLYAFCKKFKNQMPFNELLEKTMMCYSLLDHNLGELSANLPLKNQILKEVYKFLGKQLEKREKYYFSIKCYQASKRFEFAIAVMKKWAKKGIMEQEQLKKYVDLAIGMGIVQDLKKQLMEIMEQNQQFNQEIHTFLFQMSESEVIPQKRKQFFHKVQSNDIAFLNGDDMKAIQEILNTN